MYMYDKQMLVRIIEDMFEDFKKQSYEIIAIHTDLSIATEMIIELVSSETAVRSKTLITDIYAQMSEETLSSTTFEDIERKSRFYEANIRGSILSKYKFDIRTFKACQNGIQYQKLSSIYLSLATAAGTATVGGVLKYVLVDDVNIPVAVIIAGAVVAFCAWYFKVEPGRDKAAFTKAVDKFLAELKVEFILWFEEIKIYYNQCVDNLINKF